MNDKGEAIAAALEIAVDALCPGDRDGTWSEGAAAFLVSLKAQGFTVSALPVGGGVADLLGAAEWVIDAWNGGDDARFQEALACLNDAILQASSSKPREES